MGDLFNWLLGPFRPIFFGRSVAARQAMLLSTIAVAIEKQLPLVSLLETLADEAGGSWGRKVRSLADMISAGTSISVALEVIPGIVSPEAKGLVLIGAESGNLTGALREAGRQARRRSETNLLRFFGPLAYLCLLTAVMMLISSFIMIWIMPKFKTIFDGFETKLPPETELLILICDWYATYIPFVLLAFLLMLFAMAALALSPTARRLGRKLQLPVLFSGFFRLRFKAPHVLRCLGIAVDGRRPLSSALDALATRHPDRLLRAFLAEIADSVGRGDDCWQALRSARMLRPGETGLLDASQRAGNLAWALLEMADGIERRAEYRRHILAEFIQPVVIIFFGAVVGFFCYALFLPLVNLIRGIA